MARSVSLPTAGTDPHAVARLEPSMTAIDGFRRVLVELATTIEGNWPGTIERTDPEFLHHLRIAVRRTRTVLAAARHVLPIDIIDDARDEFRWLADLTSAPRDLDVYLGDWSSYTGFFTADVAAALEPAREQLQRRCLDAHLELERGMHSERATTLLNVWPAVVTAVPDEELPPGALEPLGRHVAKRVGRAGQHLVDHGRSIDPTSPDEQLHDLRKDAKKLRYLVECFGTLFPTSARKRYVKRLTALQDNLGEHQDAVVQVHMLRTLATELHELGGAPATLVALGQLVERLEQRRIAARAEFGKRFAAYDTPATSARLDEMLTAITR